MRRIILFLRSLFMGLIVGGRWWGYVRLFILIILLVSMARLSQMVYATPGIVPPRLFSVRGIRFWMMPLGGLWLALLVSGHYVRDIYELPNFRMGLRYLIASLFSLRQPGLAIKDGKKIIGEDEINLLDKIGGPGFVSVAPGSVVLLESLHAPSNVYGRGGHYVNRYERVKEIGILEDQIDEIKSSQATTKDGIRVEVRDIRYSYRLRAGRKLGDYTRRTVNDPFPYSVGAIRNMTYNRTVGTDGLTPWHLSVRGSIRGAITNYIRDLTIDELTAPGPDNNIAVREDLQRRLMSKGTRNALHGLGAELLWVDVGHFDIVAEDVDNQRVRTWGARWEGLAERDLASGEKEEIYHRELGRAEAQAEILSTLINSLAGNELGDNPRENLRTLLLLRTAQLLETVSQQNPKLIPDPSQFGIRNIQPKKGEERQ